MCAERSRLPGPGQAASLRAEPTRSQPASKLRPHAGRSVKVQASEGEYLPNRRHRQHGLEVRWRRPNQGERDLRLTKSAEGLVVSSEKRGWSVTLAAAITLDRSTSSTNVGEGESPWSRDCTSNHTSH